MCKLTEVDQSFHIEKGEVRTYHCQFVAGIAIEYPCYRVRNEMSAKSFIVTMLNGYELILNTFSFHADPEDTKQHLQDHLLIKHNQNSIFAQLTSCLF